MTEDTPESDPSESSDGEGVETTDDTPDEEGVNTPSEGGSEEGSDDAQPDIEADERASIDLEGVDLDAVDGDDDSSDDADQEASDDADDDSSAKSSAGADLTPSEGETWGDMYVDILGVFLIAIVDEYGDGDREMTAEDIEQLANQPPIALNEQADRVMEQMGGTREMPPGQALIVGSSVVGATVLLRETDVADELVGELAGAVGGGAA